MRRNSKSYQLWLFHYTFLNILQSNSLSFIERSTRPPEYYIFPLSESALDEAKSNLLIKDKLTQEIIAKIEKDEHATIETLI